MILLLLTRKIRLFHPGDHFPSVSISGPSCSMACDHCNKKYLEGMEDVSKPGSLMDFARKLDSRGGRGLLVSGGCDPRGRVSYQEHHFREMMAIKNETSLLLNLHTGLVNSETADRLGEIGIDAVSFDVLGDRRTISDVLHIDAGPDDYKRSYELMVNAGVRVVPHVLAGLNYGKISGEMGAVDIISNFSPDTTVLIILIPTRNTPMENIDPLPHTDIMKIADHMRENLGSDLILGCMRPRSYPTLERDLLDIGFSGIVVPRRDTVKWIMDRGWDIINEEICCAIIP